MATTHRQHCERFLIAAVIAAFAFWSVACNSEEEAPLAGTYVFKGSSVVSSGTGDGTCRRPILPSDSFDARYLVQRPAGASTEVTELATECRFAAEVADSVISASDVECEIPENALIRQQWGLTRRRFVLFLLDANRGIMRYSLESWQELQSGGGHSCAIGEGRLVSYSELAE